MTRKTFAESLAIRVLAREGMAAIWGFHVAAADAYRRGRPEVATMLIEIADAAERQWLVGQKGRE